VINVEKSILALNSDSPESKIIMIKTWLRSGTDDAIRKIEM